MEISLKRSVARQRAVGSVTELEEVGREVRPRAECVGYSCQS